MNAKQTFKILITDDTFVDSNNESQLRDSGISSSRLSKLCATEEELIEALQGKDGYILGGIEQVTERVIEAASQLKAIVFTGAGYAEFIPGHEVATKRGIPIANAPGGNAFAVSEYTIALMLAMTRNIFELGRTGTKVSSKTTTLRTQSVGIVGLGAVGKLTLHQLSALGVRDISYSSRTRKYDLEAAYGLAYMPLPELLRTSDIVCIHTSKAAGEPLIGASELKMLKEGALLVNTAYPNAVDCVALKNELEKGRIRAAFDAPPSEPMDSLPLESWFCSNAQSAFFEKGAVDTVSDMVTRSMINLLTVGSDPFVVNPDFLGAQAS